MHLFNATLARQDIPWFEEVHNNFYEFLIILP